MRALLVLIAALALPALAGCESAGTAGSGGAASAGAGRKLRVTATVGMVADTARIVGGDRVEVTSLMGPGVDPHLYKASQGDIARLTEADLILYNGLNLEGKMGDILSRLGKSGKPVVAVAEGIDRSLLRTPPEFQGHHDPHVWFDVSMWRKTVPVVAEALSKADPEGRSIYEEAAAEYALQLDDLHAYCKKQLATVPRERRVLVTAHDAFGYFGRAYDVDVVGLQGISTVTEAGLGDIQQKVDLITRRKVRAVFVESSVPRRAIEAVVAGCKARGHEVAIGGTLFSDAMGEEGTPEATYAGMVRFNVDTIVKALQ